MAAGVHGIEAEVSRGVVPRLDPKDNKSGNPAAEKQPVSFHLRRWLAVGFRDGLPGAQFKGLCLAGRATFGLAALDANDPWMVRASRAFCHLLFSAIGTVLVARGGRAVK